MNWIGRLHALFVGQMRVEILAQRIARLLPQGTTVLDVGCGDGELGHAVGTLRPDLIIRGVDVLARRNSRIPVEVFDGHRLPVPDGGTDVVIMIDVLHHTDDPRQLLAEAARVARRSIIIKDHLVGQWASRPTLRFMDWVGNAPHGVRLPYNYWSLSQWKLAFESLGLRVEEWEDHLGLYPFPASLLFERRMHFLARIGTGSRS